MEFELDKERSRGCSKIKGRGENGLEVSMRTPCLNWGTTGSELESPKVMVKEWEPWN